MIQIINKLRTYVPDDLINTILEHTGNIYEKPEIVYYVVSVINPIESYIFYDIITKEYIKLDPDQHYIYNCPGIHFRICECGKLIRISNPNNHVHIYNKSIPIKDIKNILKRELAITNERRVKSRLRRHERGLQENTTLKLFNIDKLDITINRHKYDPEALK